MLHCVTKQNNNIDQRIFAIKNAKIFREISNTLVPYKTSKHFLACKCKKDKITYIDQFIS